MTRLRKGTLSIRGFAIFVAFSCAGSQGGTLWAAINRDTEEIYSVENYESLLAVAQQTVAVAKTSIGTIHPDFALSLNNLAAFYSTHGHYTEAIPLGSLKLFLLITKYGPQRPFSN